METKKGDQNLKNSKLKKEAGETEKSWFEEIIEHQESDLVEEDTLADKIPNKTAAKYRDDGLQS